MTPTERSVRLQSIPLKEVKLKIIFIIVVLTVISFSIPNYGLSEENNWIVVSSSDEDTTYFDIQFIGKKGWIVGWKWDIGGVILHTTDGGNTWTEQKVNQINNRFGFRTVHFINKSEGWTADGGRFNVGGFKAFEPHIFHTTDEGNTWLPIHQKISNNFKDNNKIEQLIFKDIYFVNLKEGWAIGLAESPITTVGHILFHTVDGGKSWTGERFGEILNEVYFLNPDEGWILGDWGHLYHTTDGGETWEHRRFDTSDYLHDMQFSNHERAMRDRRLPQKGWMMGSGRIFHTQDGGRSWQTLASEIWGILAGGSFANSKDGWVVSTNGSVYYTQDEGRTWEMRNNVIHFTSGGLHDAEYVPLTGQLWAVGNWGTILMRQEIITSVNPTGKIPATWGKIKTKY